DKVAHVESRVELEHAAEVDHGDVQGADIMHQLLPDDDVFGMVVAMDEHELVPVLFRQLFLKIPDRADERARLVQPGASGLFEGPLVGLEPVMLTRDRLFNEVESHTRGVQTCEPEGRGLEILSPDIASHPREEIEEA